MKSVFPVFSMTSVLLIVKYLIMWLEQELIMVILLRSKQFAFNQLSRWTVYKLSLLSVIIFFLNKFFAQVLFE